MNTATKTRYLTIAAAMLSMAIGGWAMAQRSDTKSADQSEPTSKGWGAHMDQALMDQLAADGMMQMNKGQIELANFALKHTQNEGVRKFAETSIQNCTNLNNQLQKFAGENTAEHQGDQDRRATGDNSANGDEKKQRDSSTQHESQTAGQPNASNWKALNLDVVRHDVSNQVIASIERELAQYQGADFDRASLANSSGGMSPSSPRPRRARNTSRPTCERSSRKERRTPRNNSKSAASSFAKFHRTWPVIPSRVRDDSDRPTTQRHSESITGLSNDAGRFKVECLEAAVRIDS